MERKYKDKETSFDRESIINIDNFKLSDTDCFAQLWDMSNPICTLCHDKELCGIVFSNTTLKKKRQAVREVHGNFVDDIDFKAVDKRIDKVITPGLTTVKELAVFIKHHSKCESKDIIKHYMANYLNKNGYSIKDGVICL